VVAAAKAALAGEIAAMVTLPMNKEATQLSDPKFCGHTELIAEVCGVEDVTIMLASEQLIVTHVSTHVSMVEAIRRVKRERIETILRMTYDAVRRLKPEPLIAVAGLNPHAGEHGLFGDEERRVIAPAIAACRARGIDVSGPFPADTIFVRASRGEFDVVVACYHDQGLIPVKLVSFGRAVNVTLGLPIVRTSVDHGTAFDIAGKGIADPGSMIAAVCLAARLARDRRRTSNVERRT
jgi:4-hydroxythreonine-4-phosphate dehydrogenase